ncbi:rRNA maturation RNase YbeY [Sediminibacterium soli]|uniref:rRNA maturation RNase YbeY n=1 Tax=Sediminibacterium soli TaxID=2698829 RepID=UPI001379DAC6|nr:rRNA maturation RNase YbeY [Sediminibacterium soli]NCI47907.1 rRNA maturation RNase YbeY [Sediminibacterium soli]
MERIHFLPADKRVPLINRTALRSFIEQLFRTEKTKLGMINYIFCSDEYLLTINRDFLQHDYYTDIITFGLSAPGQPVEAEVYISVDRVKDNARNLGETIKSEMLRVIFHGALHLCGYRDKKKSEITIMREKEDRYLRLFEKRTR